MDLLSPSDPAGYLASRYAGLLDTRALWEWAGGRPDEAVFNEDPYERWKILWGKAGEGKTATDVGLLREALFDRPGDEEGLAILEGLCASKWGRWKDSAKFLVRQIGSLMPEIDEDSLWLVLQTFPNLEPLAPKPADCAFALVAGEINGVFDMERRAGLEAKLSSLKLGRKPTALEAFPSFVGDLLLATLRRDFEDSSVYGRKIQEGVSAMRAAVTAKEPARFLSAAAEAFEEVPRILPGQASALARESVKASLRSLAAMRSIADDEPPPSQSGVCEGFVQALWATAPTPESGNKAEGDKESQV